MIKLRTVGFASCFVPSVCLPSGQAFSQETSYYQGASWTIQMVKKGTGNLSSEGAYCEVKTTSFEPRSVVLQSSPSKEAGIYRTILKLRKSGWQLPIGATAKVKVGSPFKIGSGGQIIEGPPMTFKVESADTMASLLADYEPGWQLEIANAVLNGIFVRTKYGSTLLIDFIDGNEPPWNPASFEKLEQQVSFKAYEQCLSDLSQMAADPAQGGSAPLSSTSPLKPEALNNADTSSAPPVVNKGADQAEAMVPPEQWQFGTREEDWGQTCYAEIQKRDVKVGFMGSPGEHLIGFVEGVFKGDARATWHVDDKRAHVSDGGQNDYFGWHEFDQLPMDLLDQISSGKELAITGAKGERTVVSLKGASEAVPRFKACFGKH
ncbi:hypothetical protein HF263_36330 [Rhizobium leguminosarum]|uniref:hypothetical protein n=1 Tax=Rhizobium leguminosarum TaxID=384 RepID=UPI001C91A2FC|nr:hypothetical protein [Rhizobium leguminosarum]MBY2996724.1 hypothetical protein [Rhizobium leguminosarum]MBY3061436.1 hypothetical protein [Rhizobium leguminosarum]